MKFIEKVKKPTSITALMLHGMAGYDQHRGTDKLHISDLTKPDFCPREFALLSIFSKTKKGMTINAAMRHTFDMGRDIESRVQNDYLGDIAVGNWKCQSCGKLQGFRKKPKAGCDNPDINCIWRYQEVKAQHRGLTSGFDVLVDVSKKKLRLVELKTIIKEDFIKLKAPLVEHRLRTTMYLWMIKQIKPLWQSIETEVANLVYVAKSYGNWDKEQTNYSPFKEYEIPYNESLITDLIKQGSEFSDWHEDQVIPFGVCPNSMCTRASQCQVVKECFSGEYMPGDQYLHEAAQVDG